MQTRSYDDSVRPSVCLSVCPSAKRVHCDKTEEKSVQIFIPYERVILDLSNAISRKRCKIGAKLLLITNRKSHMSFRLVPNSVTLDDLERRNSPSGSVISPNSVAFGTDCVKVVEDTPILSAAECRPNNLVLAIYHLWRY